MLTYFNQKISDKKGVKKNFLRNFQKGIEILKIMLYNGCTNRDYSVVENDYKIC